MSEKLIYLLGKRGITQVTESSVLEFIKYTYKLDSTAEARSLFSNFKYMGVVNLVVSINKGNIVAFEHGELFEASHEEKFYPESYWVINPEFYIQIMEDYIKYDKEAN
jgi:hypothetical protein